MMKELKNYIYEFEDCKYLAILEYLKNFGINRSVLTNKKWSNPIFMQHKKVLSVKGRKHHSKCITLPYEIGLMFLLTIKAQEKELLDLQNRIIKKVEKSLKLKKN